LLEYRELCRRHSWRGSSHWSALLRASLFLPASGISSAWIRACASIPEVRVAIWADARATRRDLRRARGRIPSLRNSRVCRARPPVCTRTAMLLDARRADLERIRLVPATGAGLRLAILRRGSIGLVWKLAMVGSFGPTYCSPQFGRIAAELSNS